jgi:DNA mismatch endonuclease (patch repair protein)
LPKSRTDYWREKIIANKRRDISTHKQLAAMGWHTITVWECELKPARRQETLESLAFTLNRIFLKDHEVKYADIVQLDNDISMAAEERNER